MRLVNEAGVTRAGLHCGHWLLLLHGFPHNTASPATQLPHNTARPLTSSFKQRRGCERSPGRMWRPPENPLPPCYKQQSRPGKRGLYFVNNRLPTWSRGIFLLRHLPHTEKQSSADSPQHDSSLHCWREWARASRGSPEGKWGLDPESSSVRDEACTVQHTGNLQRCGWPRTSSGSAARDSQPTWTLSWGGPGCTGGVRTGKSSWWQLQAQGKPHPKEMLPVGLPGQRQACPAALRRRPRAEGSWSPAMQTAHST